MKPAQDKKGVETKNTHIIHAEFFPALEYASLSSRSRGYFLFSRRNQDSLEVVASPLPDPELAAHGFRSGGKSSDESPVGASDTAQDNSNKSDLSVLCGNYMKRIARDGECIKTFVTQELHSPLCSSSQPFLYGLFRHSSPLLFFPLLLTLCDDLLERLDPVSHALVYAELPQRQSHSVIVADVGLPETRC